MIIILYNLVFDGDRVDRTAGNNFSAITISAILRDYVGFSVFDFEYFRAKRFTGSATDANFFVYFGFWHRFLITID